MPDQPTMWELQRAIESGYRELSGDITQLNARLDTFVLREVYEAHRSADQDRIRRLEGQVLELKEGNRKALWTAISSFLAPIAVAVVLAMMLQGG